VLLLPAALLGCFGQTALDEPSNQRNGPITYQIAVSPPKPVLCPNQRIQLTAQALDTGLHPVLPPPRFSWSSDTPGLVSVSSDGLASATYTLLGGVATISASALGFSGSIAVTVEDPWECWGHP